jgi:hypothetical protein
MITSEAEASRGGPHIRSNSNDVCLPRDELLVEEYTGGNAAIYRVPRYV